jgi:hypothetical protein
MEVSISVYANKYGIICDGKVAVLPFHEDVAEAIQEWYDFEILNTIDHPFLDHQLTFEEINTIHQQLLKDGRIASNSLSDHN